MMRRSSCAAFLLLVASACPVAAQAPADQPGARRFTAALGIGNSMGWFGGQVERHLGGERASLFAGLGYMPEIDPGDPTGATFAAGVRGFTPGRNHRGFLELSISQVAVTSYGGDDGGERHYGPGLQAGYQYVADRGFTFLASAGVGRASGLDEQLAESSMQLLVGLGAGYTWR